MDLLKYYGLENKVVLLTGASGLLGRAISEEIAHFGAHLIMTYHKNIPPIDNILKIMKPRGNKLITIQADLSQKDSIKKIYQTALQEFGCIDIFIANAGIKLQQLALMTTQEASQNLFNINFNSSILLARTCMKSMLQKQWGRVIFIGSYASHHVIPGQAIYSASKAALTSWAHTTAHEVGAKNITINVVAPGAIHQNINEPDSLQKESDACSRIAARRLGKPEEVASVVVFLASKVSAYINSAIIPVDGGARF